MFSYYTFYLEPFSSTRETETEATETEPPANQKEKDNFIRYNVYAWGIPSLLAVCSAFAPGIGIPGGNQSVTLYFLYIPIILIIVINSILFSLTAYALIGMRSNLESALNTNTGRDQFKVNISR